MSAGAVYPVHPSAAEVCGKQAYPNIAALPQAPECAVVCLSADKVVGALEDAAAFGVRAAVIFASGFAEAGEEGRDRQARLEALASRTGMIICGPDCWVWRTTTPLFPRRCSLATSPSCRIPGPDASC